MATELRCAITLAYNSLHHLQHMDFSKRMKEMFDIWIVVEGHAKPGGSTHWCNNLKYQSQNSTDGTLEFLQSLDIELITKKGWDSKDEQFNAGVERLRELTDKCTLWQVDCDEVWKKDDLEKNELALTSSVGCVGFHHIVGECEGHLLLAEGRWGSGKVNRVWRWKGEKFLTHEPPTFEGQDKPQELPEKFYHFSYYFDKDVEFKQKYYRNYGAIYNNWKAMQGWKPSQFPCHVYKAFGRKNPIGITNTRIRMWEKKGMLFE